MNPLFYIDFYKAGHIDQYPSDTTYVWSNFTPRSSRIAGVKEVVHFGLQYFIKEILQEAWQTHFFNRSKEEILKEYKQVMKATLGIENPRVDHIEALHNYGYLPLKIYSIPEGFSVPLNCPMLVITNTKPDMFWLPNYMETILSNILWKPCTSATTAKRYREIFMRWAKQSGETDFSFVDWMGHDFSFRGMSGREDSLLSGMGHLLSFSGTDTIPAILGAKKYYDADLSCGGSVYATEHAVMCAGYEESELETFRRLIEDIYPKGVISIVSDTWDLWRVLTDYIPQLKNKILARDGKLVIRPDSGDPVLILCGDPTCGPGMLNRTSIQKGTLRLLAEKLGTTAGPGLPMITKAGAIYGDSITPERAEEIMRRTVTELHLSPYNVVLGIGSFTYEYVTRDTYGFAMKATAVTRANVLHNIFKKPVTDNGDKNSHKGIPTVYRTTDSTEEKPKFFCTQESKPEALDNCAFQLTYKDGQLLVNEKFDTIRKRVRA